MADTARQDLWAALCTAERDHLNSDGVDALRAAAAADLAYELAAARVVHPETSARGRFWRSTRDMLPGAMVEVDH